MTKYLLLMSFMLSTVVYGQLKIVLPSDLSTDANGTMVEVSGNASDLELEKVVWVINTGVNSISLKCKKTEIDVAAGTENTTCWKLCPATYDIAGAVPSGFVTLGGNQMVETAAAGDTIKSFAGHYRPKNIDACSWFQYDWYDENDLNTSLASVTVKYAHSTGSCFLSDDEIKFADFALSPNPADNAVKINLSGVSSYYGVSVDIYDVLGKKVKSLSQIVENNVIDTSDLTNGVFFVSLVKENEVVKTSKLIVKH